MASWDGANLHRRSSRWLVIPTLAVAFGAGALTALDPLKALVALVVLLLVACVWRWPALAAYLVIGLTPLTVGISRGAALPGIGRTRRSPSWWGRRSPRAALSGCARVRCRDSG